MFSNVGYSSKQIQELVILRLCWWLRGWNDNFPYSFTEVLQNPLCLKWSANVKIMQMRSVITSNPQLSPPSHLSLKWNTDASYDPICHLSVIGGVLQNDVGVFIDLFSCPVPPMEINPAEVYAIYRAVKISTSSPIICHHPIIFESDSANTVKWSNSKERGPWNLVKLH